MPFKEVKKVLIGKYGDVELAFGYFLHDKSDSLFSVLLIKVVYLNKD
jgi:hypothetical protein